jgi:hypothetical protein
MNPRALGWDIHRKFSQVSVMEKSADGEIRALERKRLESDDPQGMRQWLLQLDPEIPVALEATFGWPWVADLLQVLGREVHLGRHALLAAIDAARRLAYAK